MRNLDPNVPTTHPGFDLATIQELSIDFIEEIIRLQIDGDHRQDFINSLGI